MIQKTFLFFNLFSSKDITPVRLYNFGIVVLGGLKEDNKNKQFDAIIAQIESALEALFNEISGVDGGLSEQKIDTRTVDDVIRDFSGCMSDNEGVIAKALGGKTSAGFLSFYPNKLTEYSKANKTTMPLLTTRVATAAAKYAGKLGEELTEELSSYKLLFTEKYGVQQATITSVNQTRKERGVAFAEAQNVLTAAVYTVGATYPGNPEKCHSFFPFKMLRPPHRRKRYTLEGKLEKNEVKEIVNHTLNKTAEIVCANTGTNSQYAFWLAASPTEPMPADAFVIKADGAPLILKADKLGDLQKKPFVMVKNLSDINEASYEITFVGLKKAIKGAVVTTEEVKEEIVMESRA